jgi:hypothetical protein
MPTAMPASTGVKIVMKLGPFSKGSHGGKMLASVFQLPYGCISYVLKVHVLVFFNRCNTIALGKDGDGTCCIRLEPQYRSRDNNHGKDWGQELHMAQALSSKGGVLMDGGPVIN